MGEPGPRVVLPCPNCGARIRLEVEKLAQAGATEPGVDEAMRRAIDRLPLEDLMRPFRNPKPEGAM